jgi:hypothetical protein
MTRPLAVPERLYKLRTKLDHLNAKIRNVYTPNCDVSVDECLIMWKGRLMWKVYISSKHARFCIKSFELYEAKSDYVWNFIIYIVQDTIFDKSLKNEPCGSKAVLQLIAPLLNRWYGVIMDNWFSSPDLFLKLFSKQPDAMGTLCLNRKGVPAEIKSTKLKMGEQSTKTH